MNVTIDKEKKMTCLDNTDVINDCQVMNCQEKLTCQLDTHTHTCIHIRSEQV
uniref:Uncharacterized protein n=1 Tax=Arion vulgaris TaxID=1028688 RepID=A0A0B6ZBV8_9EUPU